MLKKQKENSGSAGTGMGQLAKWRDGAETVTRCLSSLCHGEVKRERRARRGSDMLKLDG